MKAVSVTFFIIVFAWSNLVLGTGGMQSLAMLVVAIITLAATD